MSIISYELDGKSYSYEDTEFKLDTKYNRLRYIGRKVRPTQPTGYTSYHSMFYNFKRDVQVKLDRWDMSTIEDLSYMFCHCIYSPIGLDNWDVSNVKTTAFMFANCDSLYSINIELWDTSNIIDMSYMFYNCTNLNEILGKDNINISKLLYYNKMFYKVKTTYPKWYSTSLYTYNNNRYYDQYSRKSTSYDTKYYYNETNEVLYITGRLLKDNKILKTDGGYKGLNEIVRDIILEQKNIFTVEYNTNLAEKLILYFINNKIIISNDNKKEIRVKWDYFTPKYKCLLYDIVNISITKKELVDAYNTNPEVILYGGARQFFDIINISKPVVNDNYVMIDILMRSEYTNVKVRDYYINNKNDIINMIKDHYNSCRESSKSKKNNKLIPLNYYKIGNITALQGCLRITLELKAPLIEIEKEMQMEEEIQNTN